MGRDSLQSTSLPLPFQVGWRPGAVEQARTMQPLLWLPIYSAGRRPAQLSHHPSLPHFPEMSQIKTETKPPILFVMLPPQLYNLKKNQTFPHTHNSKACLVSS